METGVVQQLDRLPVFVGRGRRVAAVAGVRFGAVLIPLVIHPRRTGATAAVHVHLDAARNEATVADGRGWMRQPGNSGDELPRRLDRSSAGPQREHPDRQLALAQYLLIEVPLRFRNAGILRAGHALAVEVLDQFQDAVLLLFAAQWRDLRRHELLRRFLEHPG